VKVSFEDENGNTKEKKTDLNEELMKALKDDPTQKQIYIFQRLSAISRQLIREL